MPAVKYVSVKHRHKFDDYPSAGPYPNITGMRQLYWGKDAYILKSGAYAYKVPKRVYDAY